MRTNACEQNLGDFVAGQAGLPTLNQPLVVQTKAMVNHATGNPRREGILLPRHPPVAALVHQCPNVTSRRIVMLLVQLQCGGDDGFLNDPRTLRDGSARVAATQDQSKQVVERGPDPGRPVC